jgi:hypothetical protein
MRRVRFHDDRTAGRQCGCGVSARDREREREVAGAEHGDGSDGDPAKAKVGARQGLPVRHRRIDARFQPASLAHHAGEKAQLAHRAAPLPFEARARQAAFQHGPFDQHVADAEDLLGDGLEEFRAGFGRRLAIGIECGIGERAGRIEVGLAGASVGRLQVLAAGWVDTANSGLSTGHPVGADQHFSGEH